MMRPPKRLEAPACRTGTSPLNDATDDPGINGTTLAEAPGGAGVPNRDLTSERRDRRFEFTCDQGSIGSRGNE
jgi:hypothetical protein